MPRTKKVVESENTQQAEVKEEKVTKAKKTTKVAKAKVTKKEEVKKPVVTEAKASALNVKVTPRKARYVIDVVRGKDVAEALAILSTLRHKAAPMVAKVIKSAASNATNNFNMNSDKLYVASIMASDSVKMKRYLPRAKGSASGLIKRFANIYVVVKERM